MRFAISSTGTDLCGVSSVSPYKMAPRLSVQQLSFFYWFIGKPAVTLKPTEEIAMPFPRARILPKTGGIKYNVEKFDQKVGPTVKNWHKEACCL